MNTIGFNRSGEKALEHSPSRYYIGFQDRGERTEEEQPVCKKPIIDNCGSLSPNSRGEIVDVNGIIIGRMVGFNRARRSDPDYFSLSLFNSGNSQIIREGVAGYAERKDIFSEAIGDTPRLVLDKNGVCYFGNKRAGFHPGANVELEPVREDMRRVETYTMADLEEGIIVKRQRGERII